MREDGFLELPADGIERIERGERVLEDDADAPAAQAPQFLVRQVVDAPAFEAHLAGGDAPRRLEQADDREPGDRLARAGLADDAEDFARCNGKRDVIQRGERAAPRRKFDFEVDDLEDHRSFGFRASRSQSPSRLTESTSTTSARPGKTVIHHSPE